MAMPAGQQLAGHRLLGTWQKPAAAKRKYKMDSSKYDLLFVSGQADELKAIGDALAELIPVRISRAATAEQALALAKAASFKLAVIGGKFDGDPLEMVNQLMLQDAFINTAVVSDESEADFHERSEGLGVLAQLPGSPGPQQAQELVKLLKEIAVIA
jgi:hypothetical protein